MKKLILLSSILLSALTASATEGALKGKFTVNADGDQIVFSQGNLQYHIGTKTFRFAENQWNYVGKKTLETDTAAFGNVFENGVKCYNDFYIRNNEQYVMSDYSSWMDLFEWGSGKNPTMNTHDQNLNHTFNDWGDNPISNGGNEAGLWRTPTAEEWKYIIFLRPNASERFGMATVNGIWGLILLPDQWTTPAGLTFAAGGTKDFVYISLEGLTEDVYKENLMAWYDQKLEEGLKPDYKNREHFADNVYTAEQWKKMEANGAVFLPSAGHRWKGTDVCEMDWGCGYYWSSTPFEYHEIEDGKDTTMYAAYTGSFDESYIWREMTLQDNGQSVRLVQTYKLDYSALNAAIEEATSFNLTLQTKYNDLYLKLGKYIAAAQTVADKKDATQEEIDAAIDALYKGLEECAAQYNLREACAKLGDEIGEAKDYYNSIKDVELYADMAAELLPVIQQAESVYNLGYNATKDQINTARTALAQAVEKAKKDVANAVYIAFDKEKKAQKAAADALAEEGDSEACKALITKAKADINALQYDEAKTLAENKAAIKAIVAQLAQDLEAQRAADREQARQESRQELTDSIAAAVIYHDAILAQDSTAYADIAATLQEAIDAAQKVADNPDALKEEYDAANEALNTELQKAKDEVAKIEAEKLLQESKHALSDSIAVANAILDEIGENEEYADLIAEMRAVVDAAQAVLDNPESTQEDIDAAIEQLARAAAKARASIGTHEDIDQIVNDKMRKYENEKIIIDGHLLILRNGRIYTIIGAELK